MATFSPERWHALGPYLDQALDLPEAEREGWLAVLERDEPEIAADLRSLLEEHRELGRQRFLDQGPLAAGGPPSLAGSILGAYRLVSPIGQGGMGSVWLAERCDGRFEGTAAVKLLNIALAGSGEERFRQEGSFLARLTHPHIARLVDAGVSTAGQPYLVLEHVEGEAIDRHCDRRRLGVEARLRLFLDVLAAVGHAHANLIVHRDLKPSNVLVTEDGRVKLLDFGVAKLLTGAAGAPTDLTREAGVALTPEYAAPEQISGQPISTATDVYSLGVLLYVLLTGEHPAGAALRSPADLVRATVDTVPPRPSEQAAPAGPESAARRGTTPERLRRQLRGDLDTIVGRALKKLPAERYESVADLADDVRRHLRHEPIRARPDTLAYRTVKFVRRNRLTVGLGMAVFVTAIAGAIATSLQARAAREQRDFALRQVARAEAINDLNSFLLSDAAPSGRPFTVNDLLAQAEQILAREKDKRDPTRVDVLVSIGRQYEIQDENVPARRILEEAYDLSRDLTDPSVRAKASCALGNTLAHAGELARAEELVQEGLHEMGEQPRFLLDRVFCLARGSEVARATGNAEEGIARIQTAQRLLQGSPGGFELAELRILIDLAESLRAAGRHGEAVATFEQAWARLTELGRDRTETAGTLLNNWGLSLTQLGRPLEAEEMFRRAIDLSRADESEEGVSPMLLINYARALLELGRLDEAADYVERGYTRARRTDNQVVIYQSLLLEGRIFVARSETARADAALAEVEPILERTFPPGHIAFIALASYRSQLARRRGDRQLALDLANQALSDLDAWQRAGGRVDILPALLTRRAELEIDLGRGNEAAADAGQALTLLNATAPPGKGLSTLGQAYLALGRALEIQGREAEAQTALRSAVQHLQDSLGAAHPDTLAATALLR